MEIQEQQISYYKKNTTEVKNKRSPITRRNRTERNTKKENIPLFNYTLIYAFFFKYIRTGTTIYRINTEMNHNQL